MRYLWYLLPWQFSPAVLIVCVLTVALYLRGLVMLKRNGAPVGFWRPFTFFLGLALSYAVLQTYFDFLAQHSFWVHCLQQLILHHLGPVLIVLSGPVLVLREGMPRAMRAGAPRMLREMRLDWLLKPLRLVWRTLQHPLIAPVLFVGLIYLWLIPRVHFATMIDTRRYLLMNWSMFVDGLLFWWVILAPREEQGSAAVGYKTRLLILPFISMTQIVIGAYISLVPWQLYPIYALCGRALAISPMLDQQIGGLLTWIPGAMMSLIGVIVVLRHMMREEEAQLRIPPLRAEVPESSRSSPARSRPSAEVA